MNETTVTSDDSLQRDQSFAKNLFFGEILEENLFPYPAMRERDREVLGSMVDAIDDLLSDKHADFKQWDCEARILGRRQGREGVAPVLFPR